MTKSSAYQDRGKRTNGPCSQCGSRDNRAYWENGVEHCFGCGDHKKAPKSGKTNGREKLPIRGMTSESRAALKGFPNLKPANAGHPYLKSHRHKGDISLRIVSDIRQDGNALVIGMYDARGRLRNLLYIYPDGTKSTLTRVRTKGLFHPIGDGDTERISIVEGYATGVTVQQATEDDVLVAFGCTNLVTVAEHAKSLGKRVRVCGDTGEKEARFAEEAAAAVSGVLFIPQFPHGVSGTDANDFASEFGIKKLKKQIEENTVPVPPPPNPIENAAGMSRKDYWENREALAEALEMSVDELDKQVDQRRHEVTFAKIIPWSEPIDGIKLIENIKSSIIRHVSLSENAATAIAFWTIVTYFVDDQDLYIAPMLAVLSPDIECGKTTLLKVLLRLVYRPHASSNSTPATLFRMVDEHQPTLIIDEFDNLKDASPELRGILNSGHDRDLAYVDRCVGDDYKPRRFSTFGPKAIAAIGRLPPPIESRSIIIHMRRKLEDDKKERLLRPEQGDMFDKLRRQIGRWTADNGKNLGRIQIEDVRGLGNRAFDNWKPLLQVANRIGGITYQEKIANVARRLAAKEGKPEDSARILLLKDLNTLFENDGGRQLATAYILAELSKMDDREWPEYRDGKPITDKQFAELLAPFGIKSRQFRTEKGARENPKRGYRLRDCKDAFERYR